MRGGTALFAAVCSLVLTMGFAPDESAAYSPGPVASAAPGQPVASVRRPSSSSFEGSNSPEFFYNWSGYVVTASEPFLAVESTFVQPAVTCVGGAWALIWVGFDGFQNEHVEQAGTAAQCPYVQSPEPHYYAWWEMYPSNYIQVMPLSITPGDKIHASATYISASTSCSLEVSDLSSGQHYAKVTSCAPNDTGGRQSAEWIVERPMQGHSYSPLADWRAMKLATDKAATSVRGRVTTKPAYRPISAFSNVPIEMADYPYTGETLASVGALNGTGKTFVDTWLAAE